MKKLPFIVIIFLSLNLKAQLKQDTSKNARYLIIPVLLRTPETGWGYGASGNITFKTTHKRDSLTRTSVIQALAIFTERGQNIQGLDATLYFPKEKFIGYLQAYHVYFPDRFWGIGADTKDEWSEKYIYEHLNISGHVKRKFGKHFFTGLMYDYQNVFKLTYNTGAVFDTTFFLGKNPYAVSGAGISASYDTRNDAFWPAKGFFLQTYFTCYDKALGSSYNFSKWIIDTRFFKSIFKQHIIAAQLYSYFTSGNTPFRSLAALGGQGNLRGFYQGRFRDAGMLSAIAEYRAHIYWKISLVAFGGIGGTYNRVKELRSQPLKYSFGGGLRLSMLEKEKLHLRIDYGYYDSYNSGFYFTVGESF